MTVQSARSPDAADAMNESIARRIALLRKGRQLSFDELALRSGVSKGMLVQIEQGGANPSIATLCRLASGLGVSVTDLIAESEPTAHAVRRVGADEARLLWEGPKGGSAVLRVGSQAPDMLELWTWCLHPGERYEARAHGPGTTELIHVASGLLTIEAGGDVQEVPAGESALAMTDRPHVYACAGKNRTVFTMVVYEPAASMIKPRRTKGTS
jgi:transcriptional regulator with XRE-family HTH domain